MKNNLSALLLLLMATSTQAQVSSNHLIVDEDESLQTAGVSGTTERTPPDVYILGNGGFKNLFSGEGNDNSPLTGSIAVSFKMRKSETVIGFTINSVKQIDVSTPELFGANMLTPDLGGLSFSLNYTNIIKDRFGFNGILMLANSKWRLADDYVVQSSPVVLKLNGVFAPWGNLFQPNANGSDNFITAYFTAGYSCRTLTGNIANKTDRSTYFGTSKKFFNGVELGANLVINHTTALVNVPILFNKDKIDNLTGVQIIIGVVVGGDVLKFKGD